MLGVTYKPNIADQRESPAQPVAKALQDKKADVAFHDPYVDTWHLDSGSLARVQDFEAAISEADVVVVLQPHESYDFEDIASKAKVVFDTRGAIDGESIERL